MSGADVQKGILDPSQVQAIREYFVAHPEESFIPQKTKLMVNGVEKTIHNPVYKLPDGRIVAGYKSLGSGMFGYVHAAVDLESGELWAVKTFKGATVKPEELDNEAQCFNIMYADTKFAAQQALVTNSANKADTRQLLLMPLIPGISLMDYLQNKKNLVPLVNVSIDLFALPPAKKVTIDAPPAESKPKPARSDSMNSVVIDDEKDSGAVYWGDVKTRKVVEGQYMLSAHEYKTVADFERAYVTEFAKPNADSFEETILMEMSFLEGARDSRYDPNKDYTGYRSDISLTKEAESEVDRDQFSLDLNVLIGKIDLFTKACEWMEKAHQHKLLVIDFKMGNLVIDQSGGVYMIDYGLFRPSTSLEFEQYATLPYATPDYMPQSIKKVYGYWIHEAKAMDAARKVQALVAYAKNNNIPISEVIQTKLNELQPDIAVALSLDEGVCYRYNVKSDEYSLAASIEDAMSVIFDLPGYIPNHEGLPKRYVYDDGTTDARLDLLNELMRVIAGLRDEGEGHINIAQAKEAFASIVNKVRALQKFEKSMNDVINAAQILSPPKKRPRMFPLRSLVAGQKLDGAVIEHAKPTLIDTEQWQNTISSLVVKLDPVKYTLRVDTPTTVSILDTTKAVDQEVATLQHASDKVKAKLPEDSAQCADELIREMLLSVARVSKPGEPIVIGNCAHDPEYAVRVEVIATTMSPPIAVKFKNDGTDEAVRIHKETQSGATRFSIDV